MQRYLPKWRHGSAKGSKPGEEIDSPTSARAGRRLRRHTADHLETDSPLHDRRRHAESALQDRLHTFHDRLAHRGLPVALKRRGFVLPALTVIVTGGLVATFIHLSGAPSTTRDTFSYPTNGPSPSVAGQPSFGGGEPGGTAGSSDAATATAGGPQLPQHRVPETIPSDCSIDVTRELNTWIAHVPNGSEIVFPPNGCYWVEGSLTLTRRSNLVINGNGSTFRPKNRVPQEVNRAQWFLVYGNDLTLRNMTLSGVNPDAVLGQDTAYDHNIFIRGSHDVTVDHVRGGNTYGDFVAIAQGLDEKTIPSDITVENSSADNVGRMGVSCVACDGWTVKNSTFTHIALSVFALEIEGDNRPGRRVDILDNTIGTHGWTFFQLGAPFQTVNNDISDIRIEGNRMSPDSATCVPAVSFLYTLTAQRDVTVANNLLFSRTDGVNIKSTTGVTVTGNTLIRTGEGCGDAPVGVRVTGSSGVTVADNQVTGFTAVSAIQ